MKHKQLTWNSAIHQWFCTDCGRTSDHIRENDAHFELEQYECRVPSVEMPKAMSKAPGE